jgi:hypothetical protein
MWVIGVGGDKNYYVIDGVRDRLNLTERTKMLLMLHRTYRPLGVGYEKYGMQADIEHIEYVMERQNYRFTITPLGGQMPSPIASSAWCRSSSRAACSCRCAASHASTTRAHARHHPAVHRGGILGVPGLRARRRLDCLARILDDDMGVIFPEPEAEKVPSGCATSKTSESRDFMTS